MKIVRALATIGLVAGSLAVPASSQAAVTPSTATPATADPCGYLSSTRVVPCFTDPLADDATSSRIFQSLAALTEAAAPGDSIRVMVYGWQQGQYSDALADQVVAAHQEGVDVKVVLDEVSDDPVEKKFKDAGIPLTICDDTNQATEPPKRQDNCLMWDNKDYYGPNSDLPMTHTKMFLFDIGGVKQVVAGSSNIGTWDYANAWNDMTRIRDTKLHDFLSAWWDRTNADDWQGWTSDGQRQADGDAASGAGDLPERAYAYPRVSGDPIVDNLSKISACSSDGDGDGDWDKRVYVAISKWNPNQRTGIINNLVRLDGAGCRVQVIVDWGIPKADVATMRSKLSGSSTNTTQVRWECRMHHKMIVIDGKYDGNWHELVVTGSDVWAKGSQLYSNELNVRIGGEDEQTDDSAVRRYIEHYEKLWNDHASTAVDPPTTCAH